MYGQHVDRLIDTNMSNTDREKNAKIDREDSRWGPIVMEPLVPCLFDAKPCSVMFHWRLSFNFRIFNCKVRYIVEYKKANGGSHPT